MAPRIFISYAREDQETAEALAEHLDQLQTLDLAEVWIDRDIEVGESWEATIAEAAGDADIVLLLVSHTYLGAGFAHDKELELIQDAHAHGTRVVPVIVGDCAWQAHPFIGSLQAFARGRRLERPTTVTFQRQAAELVEELRQLFTSALAREAATPSRPRTALSQVEERDSTDRTDATGLAYKGSQLQTQLYVNARPDELNRACIAAVDGLPHDATIEWRSPLSEIGYAEYRDAAFLRALELDHLASALAEFWPARGPRWDALALVHSPSIAGRGVILAEGKSYPEEMRSTSRAKGGSRQRIAAAIGRTQRVLGVNADPNRWMSGHYQLANRLAHLVWLRDQGVDAWLVQLLFTGDPARPTSAEGWSRATDEVRRELGEPALPHVGEVILPALDRSLLASSQ